MTSETTGTVAGVTTVGTGVVVDDATLIPLGIVATIVIVLLGVTWKIAREHFQIKHDIESIRQDVADNREHCNSLERLYGSRHSGGK